MHPAQVRKHCTLDEPCNAPIAVNGKGVNRVLRLSHTIADLAGSEEIIQVHLSEALQYRPKQDLV
jgi:magnesium chelatase family protein